MGFKERFAKGETPFGKHPVLSGPHIAEFAEEERTRAIGQVFSAKRALGEHDPTDLQPGHAGNFMKIIQALLDTEKKVISLEAHHKARLQEIAKQSIAEAYGLEKKDVEGLVKKTEITGKPIPIDEVMHLGGEPPEEPKERPPEEREEEHLEKRLRDMIQKRQTHNAIIQGSSISHMTDALLLAKEELDHIDPRLYNLYRLHSNLAQLIQFTEPPHMEGPAAGILEHPPFVAGHTEIHFTGKIPRAESRAVTFNVLLQEISKAISESALAFGLPKPGDLTGPEHDKFDEETGKMEHERWYFMSGPQFTKHLLTGLSSRKLLVEPPKGTSALLYNMSILALMSPKMLHARLKAISEARDSDKEDEKFKDLSDDLKDIDASFPA
ncbi:MAG TPA: hypothetical protein VGQ00_01000 [Candidatus Norongarragalinales archaeon]|jgi:hypothetical protein|nr:hypothetical protein [Candidatus Norongarragalinales archaeon]